MLLSATIIDLILQIMIVSIFLLILIQNTMEPEGMKCFLEGVDGSEFTLENIPFGVVSLNTIPHDLYPATRLGNFAINLRKLQNHGLLDGPLFVALKRTVFHANELNEFMGLSRQHWRQARETIQRLFSQGSEVQDKKDLLQELIANCSSVTNHLPVKIGDYTDFYSSRSHAFNVGSLIRDPKNALNENWLHIPIGYHGRSSSIVVSGTPLRRPRGQTKGKEDANPQFSACKRLDFEVEIGAFVGGQGNELGQPLKVSEAWNHIFGFVILNDWSFRDFQTWEYVPLGPFTAKNGMSTISPWIVTLDALRGCEVDLGPQEPLPLPYLREAKHLSYDVELKVGLRTKEMKEHADIVTSNFKYMYWSSAQQLVHHAVSGCNMRAGDMLGSGTISGNHPHQYGSMLELSWGGTKEVTLPNAQTRKFIEDGDSVIIRGYAKKHGIIIGFGDCEGTVLPVLPETQYI